MKRKISIIIALLGLISFADISYSLDILPKKEFTSTQIQSLYAVLESKFNSYFWEKIQNLNEDNRKILNLKLVKFWELFLSLDYYLKNKDRTNLLETKWKIRSALVETIDFLKNIPVLSKIEIPSLQESQKTYDLNGYSSVWVSADLMYYADNFEWGKTANWNLFSHKFFSAAKCDIPLNTLIQVWLWNKSLIVKVNDRPSCSRFPRLLDMTTTAFDFFFERYKWTQKWEFVPLWLAPKDYYKRYIPTDAWSEESIILQDKIPNSYIKNESIHINWELSIWNKDISLILMSPTGKKHTLSKYVERFFSFSYPLEETGKYTISFSDSTETFDIFVLEDSIFNWKKFQKADIPSLNNLEIISDVLWKWVDGYRIVIKSWEYHMADIESAWKHYYFSWVKDIIIPKYILDPLSKESPIKITIKATKTLTNFSHDFYIEPVEIFSWNIIIPK